MKEIKDIEVLEREYETIKVVTDDGMLYVFEDVRSFAYPVFIYRLEYSDADEKQAVRKYGNRRLPGEVHRYMTDVYGGYYMNSHEPELMAYQ